MEGPRMIHRWISQSRIVELRPAGNLSRHLFWMMKTSPELLSVIVRVTKENVMGWKGFSKILSETEMPEPITVEGTKAKTLIISPMRTNSNAIYLGPSAATGIELIPPANATTPVEKITLSEDFGNGMDLSSIYVIGTAGEGVQGLYEEH